MDQAIVIEEKLFGDCFETYDQKYGMAVFLEKIRKSREPLNKTAKALTTCLRFLIK